MDNYNSNKNINPQEARTGDQEEGNAIPVPTHHDRLNRNYSGGVLNDLNVNSARASTGMQQMPPVTQPRISETPQQQNPQSLPASSSQPTNSGMPQQVPTVLPSWGSSGPQKQNEIILMSPEAAAALQQQHQHVRTPFSVTSLRHQIQQILPRYNLTAQLQRTPTTPNYIAVQQPNLITVPRGMETLNEGIRKILTARSPDAPQRQASSPTGPVRSPQPIPISPVLNLGLRQGQNLQNVQPAPGNQTINVPSTLVEPVLSPKSLINREQNRVTNLEQENALLKEKIAKLEQANMSKQEDIHVRIDKKDEDHNSKVAELKTAGEQSDRDRSVMKTKYNEKCEVIKQVRKTIARLTQESTKLDERIEELEKVVDTQPKNGNDDNDNDDDEKEKTSDEK